MKENTTLSWDLFRSRHSDDAYRKSFEDLCKNLFSRKLNVKSSSLVEYHNQKGVEVEPIKVVKDFYSFQSKFSNDDSVLWSQFKESAEKTILEYKQLTKIINYSNGISKQKSKPRDNINNIYIKAGVKVEWIYGKQILDLLEEASNADLRKRYFGGGENLNIIPPTSTNKNKSLSALKYQSEIVEFIGRKEELSQLKEFNNSDDLVKWWIIGGTGGSGKSRLALELCNIYKAKGWHCGFVNFNDTLNFSEWDPEKPHLVVCDYVLNNEEDIIKLIHNAIRLQTSKKLSYKIRILLLERDATTVVDTLKKTDTFGEIVNDFLYDSNVLTLSDFKDEDLEKMLQALAKFFELPSDELSALYEFVKKYPSRAFLMGGLFCLHHYQKLEANESSSFIDITRNLLSREKEKWLSNTEQEDYLILATMIGGIELNKQVLSDEVKTFLNNYDPISYEKMVGETSDSYLAPLSHDLISELYILDSLKPLNALNNEVFLRMIGLSLGIDNGKELISFFTRAANDYKGHPTLKQLLKVFANNKDQFIVWLLIITNIIDKIDATSDEKLDCFQEVYRGIVMFPRTTVDDRKERNNFLTILDDFFIRLLYDVSKSPELKPWVVEYKVIGPKKELLHKSQQNASEISSIAVDDTLPLKPLSYCEDIILAFFKLTRDHQSKLSSRAIFEVNYHFVLHKLHSRQADLNQIFEILENSSVVFGEELTQVLGLLYRETMAGLVQWDYLRNEPEKVLEFTNWMLDVLEKRMPTIYLASSYSVATRIISETLRTFESRKNIMDNFNASFGEQIETDPNIATHFISSCVALMSSPLESKEDYCYLKALIKRSHQLLNKYPTPENAGNFALAIVQLARYRGIYATDADKTEILDECITLGKVYGNNVKDIVQNVVSEISIQYNILVKKNLPYDDKLLDKAIDLITSFKDNYISDTKVQMGGFYAIKFQILLEKQDYKSIERLINSIAYVSQFNFVELHHQMWTNIEGELFKRWNIAHREHNTLISKPLRNIAKYCLENLSNTNMNRGLLEHIIND